MNFGFSEFVKNKCAVVHGQSLCLKRTYQSLATYAKAANDSNKSRVEAIPGIILL